MCELLGMSSSNRATVSLSLMKLAEHGGFSGTHRDGWGVGYYEGLDVRLIKEAEAASDSEWVRFIRDHDLRSHMVIAHVRRATIGEKAYRNTQPFSRELGGRMHLFAHNGWLPGIGGSSTFRPRRFCPVGETDSEIAFCALLERMAELWAEPGTIPALDARLSVVSSFASSLRELGPANFLYSDGDALFAHGDRRKHEGTTAAGPPGLVFLERVCRRGEAGIATSGLTIEGEAQMIVIVASVPLNDEPWQDLAEGEVIAVSMGRIAMRHPARESAPFHAMTT